MAVGKTDDTTTESDDTTIDAVLDKALANYDDSPAPVETDKPDTSETPARADGRDDKGRFAPKAPKPEVGGEVLAAAEPPAQETAATETAKPAPQWTDGHFTGWKPEQRERFAALPPEVQQLVMDRQTETSAFFQRKLSETTDQFKAAEPLLKAAQDVEPFARSIGTTPHDLVRNYAAIDYNLRYAPYAEKVKLLGQIAQSYGIPFAQPEIDQFADPLQPNGQAYPVIHDLRSQVQKLQSELAGYKQQTTAYQDAQLHSRIDAFAKATNADGSPKYPFFDVVRPAMGQLISSGKAASMEDAYALAAKPLEQRLAAEAAAKQAAAQEAQAAVVARAKKAAPVRSSGAQPNGKTKGTSLDDILNQSLAQHGM